MKWSAHTQTNTHKDTHTIDKQVCAFIPWGAIMFSSQTHVQCRYKQDKRTDEHRSEWTGIQKDTRTHAGSKYWDAPLIWQPLDPSSGYLKGLKTILSSFFLFLTPSLPLSLFLFLSSTFCPRFGLCPDNQSEWWLCFQLSQPPFLYHRIISSCSVGNIQESRADEPKEMFWDAASTAKPNWDQTHIGLRSGRGGGLCAHSVTI